MGINLNGRFENHTNISDVSNKTDYAEKVDVFLKNSEDKDFEKICSSIQDAPLSNTLSDTDNDWDDSFEEQIEKGKTQFIDQTFINNKGKKEVEYDSLSNIKSKISGINYNNSQRNYQMNSLSTIYEIGKEMNSLSQEFYTKALYSGDNPKVKLIGKGEKFYMTGENASGNFLTKEYPGKTVSERKENLQLPPLNDGKVVSEVKSLKSQVIIESTIVAQPDWAEESGYNARQGIKQIYTPNSNPTGAINDKRYEKDKK